MSCKSRLDDLLFGTGGNSITEITKNAKLFAAKAVSEWPKIVTRIYKERSQKIIDFIRAKAPWLPGGQHGDDIGTVLDDDEYARFQAVCDTITKRFADDGKYTRYIDAEELSLYFRDNPRFFKDGYTQAIMGTTEHARDHAFDPTFVSDHITKLTATDATARRTQWHAFIDDLQQGLIDEFGEVRGKKLADDLGITAAKDASDINKVIFKWGKSMWDDVFARAKAAGATDAEATALAKIAATSHINVAGGINSGTYTSAAAAKTGLIAWMKQHPLWAIAGSTGVGMTAWWFLDNYTFHIWMGRAAGILDKLFGDQADEATYRLKSASFQLKEHTCETSVQQTYVTLLTELKRLVDYCNVNDVIPEGKIPQYKELYKAVYGIDIGNPNEFERMYIYIDYQFYTDEYVLTVRAAGCTDPIAPPDGWPSEPTTGSILCTTTPMGYGAKVTDGFGVLYGIITDASGYKIEGLSLDKEYVIKIVKDGNYTECAETFRLTEADPEQAFPCDINCTDWVDTVSISMAMETGDPAVNIQPGSTIQFTGAATSARDITDWFWEFNDPHCPTANNTSSLQNPKHRYAKAGIFPVTLTATNACGNSKAGDAEVWVEGVVVEEAATIDVKTPIDSQTGKAIVFPIKPYIFVDRKAIDETAPYAIPFGGFGELPVKDPTTVTIKAAGYQDQSATFYLTDGYFKSWVPYMDPVGYVPPVGKFPIDFYIPEGAILSEPVKITTVSRIVTGMRRIRGR